MDERGRLAHNAITAGPSNGDDAGVCAWVSFAHGIAGDVVALRTEIVRHEEVAMRLRSTLLSLSIAGAVFVPRVASGQPRTGFAIGGVGGDVTSGPTVFWQGGQGWGAYAEWREGSGAEAPVRERYSLAVTRSFGSWFGVYAGGGIHRGVGGTNAHPIWGLVLRPHRNVIVQLAGEDGKGGAGLGLALSLPVYSAVLDFLFDRAPDVTRVRVGMPAAEVRRILGSPARVHRVETAAGRSEQWEYRRGVFVYLVDGVVTGVQQLDAR